MKENPIAEQNSETKPADNQNVDTKSAVEGNDSPNAVPYARFNDVTKKNRELQEQLESMNKKIEADRVAKLEEQGKYKELNQELQDKVAKYEEKLAYHTDLENKERESLLQQLSKEDQELYGELNTEKLRSHVSKVSKVNNVRTDASAPVRGNPLGIKHDSDVWKMDQKDRQKNWTDVIRHFKKK